MGTREHRNLVVNNSENADSVVIAHEFKWMSEKILGPNDSAKDPNMEMGQGDSVSSSIHIVVVLKFKRLAPSHHYFPLTQVFVWANPLFFYVGFCNFQNFASTGLKL